MLIVNADDWGRSRAETDAALACFRKRRITSVTAMVFMEDSERAAELARECGLDAGLHLNLTERFTGNKPASEVVAAHNRICRFLTRRKYSFLVYHPFLFKQFRCVYAAQLAEFKRLYGRPPSHIDGHQHMHLCANVVWDPRILEGEKVRRNFSFARGEKSWLNRKYRALVDAWLARRSRSTHHFFDLAACLQRSCLEGVIQLAGAENVELMTHPIRADEYAWLLSDRCDEVFGRVKTGSYAML